MKIIQLILLFLLIGVSTFAQLDQAETTHYVFPAFTEGVVLQKNGSKQSVKLNYNALTEEMVFENNGRKLAFAENEIFLTDTVYIEDRKFIVMNGIFVEYLDISGCELYVEYKCRVKDPTRPSAYGGTSEASTTELLTSYLSNNGSIYEINLPGNFVAEPYFHYWLNRNGETSRFINLRQLRKLYKDRKDAFNTYVHDNEVKYKDMQSVIGLIEYLESSRDQ